MKKAYTCLLIGCLFIWLDLSIMGINVLPDFVGYILIVIGVYFGEKHQRIQEFIQAKYLGIALSIYCLIYPLFQQFSGIEVWWPLVALTLTANLATIYLFYSLLKAEYLWHPQTRTRQFINNYLTLAITHFISTCLTFFIPVFAILAVALEVIQAVYLIYIFYTLREQQTETD